jgi:hypothetical protein
MALIARNGRRRQRPAAPAFDLDERHKTAAPGNDIDFSGAGTAARHMAMGNDGIAFQAQQPKAGDFRPTTMTAGVPPPSVPIIAARAHSAVSAKRATARL